MSALQDIPEQVFVPAFERLLADQHPIALARNAVRSDGSLNPQAMRLWRALHDGGWLDIGGEAMREEVRPELLPMGEASGRCLLSVPLAFSALVLAPLLEAAPDLDDGLLAAPLGTALASGRIDLAAASDPLFFDYYGDAAGYYQLARKDGSWVLRRLVAASPALAGMDAGVPVLALSGGDALVGAERPLALDTHAVLRGLHPFFVFQYGHLLGAAGAALDCAIAYAKERRQFGRAIGEFQGVKHALANAWVALDNARYAADALAQWNGDVNELAKLIALTDRLVSAGAKLATRVTVQVHGGIGFAWEHDAHLYLKRVYKTAAQMTHLASQVAWVEPDAAP